MMAKKQTPIFSDSVALKVDDKKLHFKATEPVKIKINAKCNNVDFPKEDIEYCWSYSDSCGFSKELITKTGIITLNCPNFFCGRTMTVKVRVLLLQKISTLNGGGIIIPNTGLSPASAIFEDTISFRPTCEKQLAKEVTWSPKDMEMNASIGVTIDIRGYNGDVVGLRRMIWTTNEELWMQYEKVVVKDNFLYACLERKDIVGKLQTNTTYTFVVEVVDASNGSCFERYKKEFSVKKTATVEELDGFPLQPVVVGAVDIMENNFNPCKYLQVDVEYTKDPSGKEKSTVTVFQEGAKLKAPIYLLGGTRKVSVNIEKYTPDRCKLKSGSHKNKEALLLHYGQTSPTPVSISVSGETGKIENLEFEYNYSISQILKSIWPISETAIQTSTLTISSCRHTREVVFKMCTEVKWRVSFSLEMGEKVGKIRNTNLVLKMGYETTQDSAEITLTNDGITGSDSLKSYVQKTLKPNFETYVNVLYQTIEFFERFQEFFDIAQKELKEKYQGKYKDIPTIRKVIDFDLILPSFALGFEWETVIHSNFLGIKATGDAKGKLIGIKIVFDLLAAASKLHTGARAFVAAMDLATYIFDAEVRVDIKIEGELSIEGSFTYNGAERTTEGEMKVVGEITASIVGEFTIKASENQKIQTTDGEVTTASSGSYGVEGSGGVEIAMGIKPDDKGFLGSLNGKFTGLEISCFAKSMVENGNKGSTKPSQKSKKEVKGKWRIKDEESLFDEKQFYIIE